jgi:arylsulfatase A-like enzyme
MPPNIIFVFADQMRAQATGYAGDPNAFTPNLDRLVNQSTHMTRCISGYPVCCPARASLITGQYPLTHGVFINDVPLSHQATSIAQAVSQAGYDTGYIGKWHLHAKGRGAFIPKSERHGFDYWQVRECTHNYWNAHYYADTPERKIWDGYDAFAQADQACDYIKEKAQAQKAASPADQKPFMLMLSWGPPHDPYQTAPPAFKRPFKPENIILPPNVPPEHHERARVDLAGYYSHIAALDWSLGNILRQVDESGIAQDTIFVFWSDHGDMVGSRGHWNKQRPWDESIRVPLLIRWPAKLGGTRRDLDAPINTPDLMPTLLSLAGVPIPKTVQGRDYANYIQTGANPPADDVLISCVWPFAQFTRVIPSHGAREYRGVRTTRYTFVRDLNGPWLLYDNQLDPYQLQNLVNLPEHASLQLDLDRRLQRLLYETQDSFEPGINYIRRHNYQTDYYDAAPYQE